MTQSEPNFGGCRFFGNVREAFSGRIAPEGASMKSKISQVDDFTVVELSGYLDFENSNPLAASLEGLYKSNKQAKVIIDLTGLEFVGSSGISNFVKSLRTFNKLRMKPAYCGMKNEFIKLFRAFEAGSVFDIWPEFETAKDSAIKRYAEWESRTLRSKRTH